MPDAAHAPTSTLPLRHRGWIVVALVVVLAAGPARSWVAGRYLPPSGFVELYFNTPELAQSGLLPGDTFKVTVANRFAQTRTFHPMLNRVALDPVTLASGSAITLELTAPNLRVGESIEVSLAELPHPLTLRVR